MKSTTLVAGLGVTVSIGLSAASYIKSYVTGKKVDTLLNEVDDLSGNIDIDIPETIVKAAMKEAAGREAAKVANEEVKWSRMTMSDTIKKSVEAEVNRLKPDLKKKLENEIEKISLDDIKKDVTVKVAQEVIKEFSGIGLGPRKSSTAEIVKECLNANMALWQIRDILNAIKE